MQPENYSNIPLPNSRLPHPPKLKITHENIVGGMITGNYWVELWGGGVNIERGLVRFKWGFVNS